MNSTKKHDQTTIFLLGILFFVFGFVTWLNGTLIPYLKLACQLNNFQAYFVTFAFYISYFVMALPSSAILNRIGFKKGMVLGLIVMALGALLFIPAAMTRTYGLFLTGLFVIGTGLSVLQTASNPYITIVGPVESAAKRISIMGICNKVAGVLAPIILGAIVLANADDFQNQLSLMNETEKVAALDGLAAKVIFPYACMAALLVILSLFVMKAPLPEIATNNDIRSTKDEHGSILNHKNLIYGIIALFLYVGAEVIAADTIGNYGNTLGIPMNEARNFPSYTLASMVFGYIIGILFIPKYLSQEKALLFSALTGIVFTLICLLTDGYVSVMSVALLGLGNALMWPAIWPLAIKGLGKYTSTGSALLIMAIAGGAILPLVYGHFADIPSIGQHKAYALLIPCYLFIGWYSLRKNKN